MLEVAFGVFVKIKVDKRMDEEKPNRIDASAVDLFMTFGIYRGGVWICISKGFCPENFANVAFSLCLCSPLQWIATCELVNWLLWSHADRECGGNELLTRTVIHCCSWNSLSLVKQNFVSGKSSVLCFFSDQHIRYKLPIDFNWLVAWTNSSVSILHSLTWKHLQAPRPERWLRSHGFQTDHISTNPWKTKTQPFTDNFVTSSRRGGSTRVAINCGVQSRPTCASRTMHHLHKSRLRNLGQLRGQGTK